MVDSRQTLFAAVLAGAAFAACYSGGPLDRRAPSTTGPVGAAVASPSGAQRLTQAQYKNAIHDLFGEEIVVPTALEPDIAANGFEAVGAKTSALSTRGVEQYETAAYSIGKQIATNAALLGRVLTCAPAAPDDAACARTFVAGLGPRVYRRPLTDAEIASVSAVVTTAGAAFGSFQQGVAYGVARMLQSPHFLYRPAVGEPDPDNPGKKRYTAYELATRLSFFLWNTVPDAELLDAARINALGTYDEVSAQVDRMLASPKARAGLRNFVREWLRLGDLDTLTKDSMLFTTYTSELGPMAREETLRVFEAMAFDDDADIRDVMTTHRTFVTPKLASMYMIAAPSEDGFAPVELPADGLRRGLLGHLSILSLYAHPTTSSATLRGKFVREKLLCTPIPLPPVNLSTGLPEASPDAPTLRARTIVHIQDPTCASCHKMMDPIGFGLEQFDGIGRLRVKENGAQIDPTGDLDGVAFSGAASLGQVIHDHPLFAGCFARKVYQYATASDVSADEQQTVAALAQRFGATGYKLKALLAAVATSPAFRAYGEPQ